MRSRQLLSAISFIPLFSALLNAQISPDRDPVPLKNWPAPLYWQPENSAVDGRQADSSLTPTLQNATVNLVFVGITPCRVVDTRVSAGFPYPFGPPSLAALVKRTFPIQSSTRCSIPSTALAYSFNVTVVPVATPGVSPLGFLGFLTLYPTGASLPNASTLNNYLGTVVANAAIVPGGINGAIDAYTHDATDMIIDINGYYVQGTGGSSGTTTVAIGTTTTGAAGTQASVSNSGSATAAVLNFTIPQGAQGPNGLAGPAGPQGPVGPQGPAGAGVTTSASLLNTAAGIAALASDTTGLGNTAYGSNALQNNTIGNSNTATGYQALSANNTGAANTAMGFDSLVFNTTGVANTATGYYSLSSNSTGFGNTAHGSYALSGNTTGDSNTACGYNALTMNTTGRSNTACGFSALQNNSTGGNNTALGYQAGYSSANGSYNIMVGNQGLEADDHAIRIGDVQTKTFVAGIRGVTTGLNNALPVVIDSNGQLGTAPAPALSTVNVGTTTTAAAGTQARVTNSGNNTAVILDFTIPQGAPGATGPAGPPGAPGTSGYGNVDYGYFYSTSSFSVLSSFTPISLPNVGVSTSNISYNTGVFTLSSSGDWGLEYQIQAHTSVSAYSFLTCGILPSGTGNMTQGSQTSGAVFGTPSYLHQVLVMNLTTSLSFSLACKVSDAGVSAMVITPYVTGDVSAWLRITKLK